MLSIASPRPASAACACWAAAAAVARRTVALSALSSWLPGLPAPPLVAHCLFLQVLCLPSWSWICPCRRSGVSCWSLQTCWRLPRPAGRGRVAGLRTASWKEVTSAIRRTSSRAPVARSQAATWPWLYTTRRTARRPPRSDVGKLGGVRPVHDNHHGAWRHSGSELATSSPRSRRKAWIPLAAFAALSCASGFMAFVGRDSTA